MTGGGGGSKARRVRVPAPTDGIKRERGAGSSQRRGCPRNCKRRARASRCHWIRPGRRGPRPRPASQETCPDTHPTAARGARRCGLSAAVTRNAVPVRTAPGRRPDPCASRPASPFSPPPPRRRPRPSSCPTSSSRPTARPRPPRPPAPPSRSSPAAELEADGRPFVLDALADLPGVTVDQSGPPGTFSGFAVRGAPGPLRPRPRRRHRGLRSDRHPGRRQPLQPPRRRRLAHRGAERQPVRPLRRPGRRRRHRHHLAARRGRRPRQLRAARGRQLRQLPRQLHRHRPQRARRVRDDDRAAADRRLLLRRGSRRQPRARRLRDDPRLRHRHPLPDRPPVALRQRLPAGRERRLRRLRPGHLRPRRRPQHLRHRQLGPARRPRPRRPRGPAHQPRRRLHYSIDRDSREQSGLFTYHGRSDPRRVPRPVPPVRRAELAVRRRLDPRGEQDHEPLRRRLADRVERRHRRSSARRSGSPPTR